MAYHLEIPLAADTRDNSVAQANLEFVQLHRRSAEMGNPGGFKKASGTQSPCVLCFDSLRTALHSQSHEVASRD